MASACCVQGISSVLPHFVAGLPILLAASSGIVQVFRDLSAPKFEWDRPHGWNKSESHILENVQVVADPYACAEGSHAICVLTEWDEFKVRGTVHGGRNWRVRQLLC